VRIGAGSKGNGDYARHNRFRSVAKIAGMKKKADMKRERDVNSPARIALSAMRISFMFPRAHVAPAAENGFRDTNCAQLSRDDQMNHKRQHLSTDRSDGWIAGRRRTNRWTTKPLSVLENATASAILGDVRCRASSYAIRTTTDDMHVHARTHSRTVTVTATNHASRSSIAQECLCPIFHVVPRYRSCA